jgi:hypothetical protein
MYLSCSLDPFFSYGEIIAIAAGSIVKNGKHFLERKTQDIPNRPETATLLPEVHACDILNKAADFIWK